MDLISLVLIALMAGLCWGIVVLCERL